MLQHYPSSSFTRNSEGLQRFIVSSLVSFPFTKSLLSLPFLIPHLNQSISIRHITSGLPFKSLHRIIALLAKSLTPPFFIHVKNPFCVKFWFIFYSSPFYWPIPQYLYEKRRTFFHISSLFMSLDQSRARSFQPFGRQACS